MPEKCSCPICGSLTASTLAHRKNVPILQNEIFSTTSASTSAARGDLEILYCNDCGFVWNAAFEMTKISYTPEYENCQTHSVQFRQHVSDRAQRIAEYINSQRRPLTVVEVGCGQGDFLEKIVKIVDNKALAAVFGFDPAWRGGNGTGPSGAKIYRSLFDHEAVSRLQIVPDVIVSRHTIEHIHDPLTFLRSIKSTTKGTAKLFIETPCNQWIMQNKAFHDLFYEHCSIFDIHSMSKALRLAKFTPTSISRVFGQQYLWAEGNTDIAFAGAFNSGEAQYARTWRDRLTSARRQGKVAVWGAGAKGATFLFLVDPECDIVDAVVDLNPKKQGRFISGTGHRILSPERAIQEGIQAIFVVNPNYLVEISEFVHSMGWQASITPIGDATSD